MTTNKEAKKVFALLRDYFGNEDEVLRFMRRHAGAAVCCLPLDVLEQLMPGFATEATAEEA